MDAWPSTAGSIRFGVISDTHVAVGGAPPFRWHGWYRLDDSVDRFERAVERCLAEGVDALLLPGDVTHAGDRVALDAVMGVLARCGRPAWIAGGNHDTLGGPDLLDEALAATPTATVRGVDPSGEAFHGLIVAGGHARALGDRRYRTDLPAIDRPGLPLVWLTHFPTLATEDRLRERGIAHAGDARNREEVVGALAGRTAPTLLVAGHLHVRDAVADGPLLQVSSAAVVEPPFEVSIIDVVLTGDSGEVRITCHALDDAPAGAILPVVTDPVSSWCYGPDDGWRPVVAP